MIKAVFFDVYGTLVKEDNHLIEQICQKMLALNNQRSYDDISKFWYQSFTDLCLEANNQKFVCQRELERQSIKATLEFCDIKHSLIDGLTHEMCELLFEYWQAPQIFEHTLTALTKIKSLDIKVVLVSNIDQRDLEMVVASTGIKADLVLSSELANAYKPLPNLFELALKQANLETNQVIHVGDCYSADVIGASNLGIKTIWISNKQNPDSVADLQVIDINDVPDAVVQLLNGSLIEK